MKWITLGRQALVAIALLVLSSGGQTGVGAQDAPMLKVGDHVENVGVYKGVVTEIGAGSYKGCYRVRSDNAGNPEYKGDFVCTLGQPGILFLPDANGRRVRDVNAPGNAQADAKKPAEDVDVKAQRTADGRQNAPDDTQGGFKAGDRVEGQIGSKWKKCTVVEHRATGGYTLRCDDRPLEEIIFAASQVRAMQSPDTDGGRQVAQDAKQTVDQAMAQCSGEPLLNLRTKGRAASDALFREVIRSMFDKEPRGEERIHKVVTKIVKFEVGKPYSWRPGTDNQRLGQAKMVYPVKTTFVTCDDGVYDWGIAEYQDYNYSCYVAEANNGEWSCATYGLGTIKSRLIPKPATK